MIVYVNNTEDAEPHVRSPRDDGTFIAMSSYLDDTTRRANLILPLQVDVERFNAIEPPSLRSCISLSRPAVAAMGECRHPGDVLLALATALGKADDLPWSSYSEMVQSQLREVEASLPGRSSIPFGGFYENAVDRGGIWATDIDARAPAGPQTAFAGPQDAIWSDGDMQLVVFESSKFGDGRGANRPWLQELPDTLSTVMWGSWAEISTHDADALGIETGTLLEVESSSGKLEVAAVVSPAPRPGTIAIPLGLGYEDFGRYAAGRGVNPLELLGGGLVEGTGALNLGGTRVRIRVLGKGRLAVFGRGLREADEIPTGWAPHIIDPKESA